MSANEIADRIITALEGRFRDWLMSDEHAEARSLVAEIVERELGADTRRSDWLADPKNHIGNVQLPREIVERNIHSLRAAIDEAMRNTGYEPTAPSATEHK